MDLSSRINSPLILSRHPPLPPSSKHYKINRVNNSFSHLIIFLLTLILRNFRITFLNDFSHSPLKSSSHELMGLPYLNDKKKKLMNENEDNQILVDYN